MISIKSAAEIEKMRRAGVITAKVINALIEMARPRVSTEQMDKEAARLIKKLGAKSAFYGYRGFPKNICTSINEEVVHGIPGKRTLKESDIIGIDVGVEIDGYCADAAVTVGVGRISSEAQRLIEVTKRALDAAIEAAITENRLSDISFAIQKEAERNRFSVVKEFVGHGIGTSIHEDPQIPNFGEPHMGPMLKSGMVLAIEPMINLGVYKVEVLNDGWTAVTADRKLSAHFEHTIAITDEGPEILTKL
ncbi:MAG: type I methionyl aminopeptidase [Candidatus Omnitrophica bacterium]|nr:type I methionyl aminopeptidase [Candidatus Omnitrophota bacterium]